MMSEANERAVVGNNNPPDEFITIASEVADLRAEALLHLDGVSVATQAQCDALDSLYKTALALESKADAARKAARKEADEIIAQIQARYNPLLADAERIKKAARAGIVAWKQHLQAVAAKEAERVASEARIAREAAEAEAKAARDANNLEAIEAADVQLANADTLDVMAKKAAKPIATGLRTYWIGAVENYSEYLEWLRVHRLPDLIDWMDAQVKKDVFSGGRVIPGVNIRSEKR